MYNDGYDNYCQLVVGLGEEYKDDRDVLCGCAEYLGSLDSKEAKSESETQSQSDN